MRVRVVLPAEPSAPVRVEMEGPFGAARGRRLRLARGAVGAYRPFAFARFVRALAAHDRAGGRIAVDETEPGVWRLAGRGDLARVAYEIDTAAAEAACADPLIVTRRRAGHAVLSGYGLYLLVDGAEERPHLVELEAPAGWRIAWALPRRAGGAYRAANAFELLDEPAMVGPSFLSRRLEGHEPERWVHVWAGDAAESERALAALAAASELSARGIAALGLPSPGAPYHIFFELFPPGEGLRLGWALEHGRSFHGMDAAGGPEAPAARLAYHVIHHELHAWIPRRLATDRLRPERQLAAEPTEFIFFAEGFPQYLAFCALARSGGAGVEDALRMLARRFAATYVEERPPEPLSLAALSLRLSAGNHEGWSWEFAAGGLLALWIDERLRARGDGTRGLSEAIRDLHAQWADRRDGIEEGRFEEVLGEACGLDLRETFARHVRGTEPLPLEEILAGAGIVAAGDGFQVLADAEVAPAVRRFRRLAFR